MDIDPADIVLHLIARITDSIEFPVGDAEFDAVLDDCIAALEGAPSPAEDRARAERSLRALLDQTGGPPERNPAGGRGNDRSVVVRKRRGRGVAPSPSQGTKKWG